MFKRTKPRKSFVALSGVEYHPVATLVDSSGGVCHVIRDDGCYVVYIYVEDSGFVPVTHIFGELHEVLASLPSPEDTAEAA